MDFIKEHKKWIFLAAIVVAAGGHWMGWWAF